MLDSLAAALPENPSVAHQPSAISHQPARHFVMHTHQDKQDMESVDSILAGKYPAKAHAAKVAAHLKSIDPSSVSGTIYLEGQQTRLIEDNDEPQPFRYHDFALPPNAFFCS